MSKRKLWKWVHAEKKKRNNIFLGSVQCQQICEMVLFYTERYKVVHFIIFIKIWKYTQGNWIVKVPDKGS